VIPATMRAARLHGPGDLRVEELEVPEPTAREVLVRVEACGVCPTDARKYAIGAGAAVLPLNPGHEWVGEVVARGEAVERLEIGERVYGDTYAGYAEFAAIGTEPEGWSRGALPVGALPVRRAVFVEPLADCLHAVHDQGRVRAGQHVVVVGAGSMGLQMVAAATHAGARVLAVEPRAERRSLAERFGADAALEAEGWPSAVREWAGEPGPQAVILTVPRGELAAQAVEACGAGGRVVLFAGFGEDGSARIDLNRLHYEEIALLGSEWVGTPPHQRFERYEQARDMLARGLALEELVLDEVALDGLEGALQAVREGRSLKTILVPEVRS